MKEIEKCELVTLAYNLALVGEKIQETKKKLNDQAMECKDFSDSVLVQLNNEYSSLCVVWHKLEVAYLAAVKNCNFLQGA